MPERSVVVINTGPLVAFSRSNNMHVLRDLPIRFVVTDQVAEELAAGAQSGHKEIDLTSFDRCTVTIRKPDLDELLDSGEASVIQAALDQGIKWVAIDEQPGRKTALRLGLRLTGTLGLLCEAKRCGALTRIGPEILKIEAAGTWFSDAVIAEALKIAGEQSGAAGAEDAT